MSYEGMKYEAEELLELAAAYAGDGAIETAILRAERALRVLRRAKTEKAKMLSRLDASTVKLNVSDLRLGRRL